MALRGTEAPAIVVRGFSSAIKAMEAIGGKEGRKVISMANKEAAEPVKQEAQSLAPVRSGKLRNSIRIRSQLRRVQIVSGGARVPYSNPIHWGWFYDRVNQHYRNIKPNPFMARALNYKREDIKKRYIENVDKMLAQQAAIQKIKSKVED